MRELVPACPPGALGLEDQRVEALRRRVHRGRQARGSRAEHHDVVDARAVSIVLKAQALGERRHGRPLVGLASLASDPRSGTSSMLERAVRSSRSCTAGSLIDVEVRVRVAVAGQELLQWGSVSAEWRESDQHQIAVRWPGAIRAGPRRRMKTRRNSSLDLGVGLGEQADQLVRAGSRGRASRRGPAPLTTTGRPRQQVDVPAELARARARSPGGRRRRGSRSRPRARRRAAGCESPSLPDEPRRRRSARSRGEGPRCGAICSRVERREDLGPVWPGNDRGTRRIGAGFALAHEADLSTRPLSSCT